MQLKKQLPLMALALVAQSVAADPSYVEPGSLRLSHEIVFENVLHRTYPGWQVQNGPDEKIYSKTGSSDPAWKSEWGQSLLTEAAARVTPDIFGRVLFEAQGDYADRFWRPNNIEHHTDNEDRHIFLRQAEARIDRDEWFLHGFKGVGHGDWRDKGDFFQLYPASYPDDDYLGSSGYFGIYPDRYRQDMFLNISKRNAPRGIEGGLNLYGWEFGAAYGNELAWGYGEVGYGYASAPIGSTRLTFTLKNENVPTNLDPNNNERDRAYALAWKVPSEQGHLFEVGIKYQPFRLNKPYQSADEVGSGIGLLGSSWAISQKETERKDAFAERIRYERHSIIGDREVIWSADLAHMGLVAGNKDQADLRVGTNLSESVHGILQYTYRRPVEGPVPFLYEGTPDNIGAVASNPRGPDDPFTVNWDNREAVFLTATVAFDSTPGTSLFIYNPDTLQMWNVNPEENSPVSFAFQYQMKDYRTTTDRLFYYDQNGNIVYEPAGHSGAWASDHPLSEFRLLVVGKPRAWSWVLGFAGGQSPAISSLAYSHDTRVNKPITDYYSIEGRLERWPFVLWGHFGSGVWGSETYQRFFGESYDRLWGGGLSYKITVNTTVDVSYLAARQDDNLFVAPDLGAYDEIRTLFSHRFGFLFQFSEAARTGYQAR